MRARPSFVGLAFAALGIGLVAGSSAAGDNHPYSLHVQGHLGSADHLVDIDVPWETDHGGSPFDFTSDRDDIGFDRLRQAWIALKKMPEGRYLTIETESDSIRASRWAGYLVLEPLRGDDGDNHHSRIEIPDYIVQAIVDHDGRLTEGDIERLLHQHGKVTLVKVNSDEGDVMVWMDRARRDPD